MTTEEIQKDPNLVGRVIDEVHKNFYGEVDTIITLIISINTRLVKNCKAESRNIVLSSMSGSGKDMLVKTIAKILLIPEVTYFHRTKLTPEVFTYWKTGIDDSWEETIVHIEDPTPELMNCQGFKTMASGEKKATVIDRQRVREISPNGKPNMIITTYEGITNLEGSRRFPFIRLDIGEKLTDKVITKICNRYTGNDITTVDNELVEALQKLKQYEVVIPFADELIEHIPSTLLMRTFTSRLLDYIASSCVLHQYQREKTDDGKLIATWNDYEYGRLAFLKTITNNAMASLSPQQQELLDVIISNNAPMVVSEIHKNIGKSRDWIYRNLEVLKGYKLIEQGSMFKMDANKEVRTYNRKYSGYFKCNLPMISGCLGCLGCREYIKKYGSKRNDGSNELYDIYYNNIYNTIQPIKKDIKTTKCNTIQLDTPTTIKIEGLEKQNMKEHPELTKFKRKLKGKHWTEENIMEWIELYQKYDERIKIMMEQQKNNNNTLSSIRS